MVWQGMIDNLDSKPRSHLHYGETTTRLKIQVTHPNAAETELLRLVMADSTTVVTQFERAVYDLEDVFVNLVEGGTHHGSQT